MKNNTMEDKLKELENKLSSWHQELRSMREELKESKLNPKTKIKHEVKND